MKKDEIYLIEGKMCWWNKKKVQAENFLTLFSRFLWIFRMSLISKYVFCHSQTDLTYALVPLGRVGP